MPIIFAAADLVSPDTQTAAIAVMMLAVIALTGAVVGAVEGVALITLAGLQRRAVSQSRPVTV